MFQGKEVILIFNLSILFCMLVSRSSGAFLQNQLLKQNNLLGIVPGCQTCYDPDMARLFVDPNLRPNGFQCNQKLLHIFRQANKISVSVLKS